MEFPAPPGQRVGGLSLKAQFLLGSLAVLLVALVLLGIWLTRQITDGVVHRTAAATALYVDSLIFAPLQDLASAHELSPASTAKLDALLTKTPLGREVALFQVWDRDGHIVYSTLPARIGHQFPVVGEMATALGGQVADDIGLPESAGDLPSDIARKELLEIYSPVRAGGTGEVIAAAEFYYAADDLRREIDSARLRSWLALTAATGLVYLALAAFVQRASDTITGQQAALADQVTRLADLLGQNERLHDRVRTAAARTTALNERFLRRIAAELHDGPAQEISLALLRLDRLQAQAQTAGSEEAEELERVDASLRRALQEVRATSSGLLLPHLADLTLIETVDHAVRGHRKRTGVTPGTDLRGLPADAPLPTKIALYRIVQEGLTNAWRHAPGTVPTVRVEGRPEGIRVEVADDGPGFDAGSVGRADGPLGLAGMRERAESLGGEFRVESAPGAGTRVVALLPLEGEA